MFSVCAKMRQGRRVCVIFYLFSFLLGILIHVCILCVAVRVVCLCRCVWLGQISS